MKTSTIRGACFFHSCQRRKWNRSCLLDLLQYWDRQKMTRLQEKQVDIFRAKVSGTKMSPTGVLGNIGHLYPCTSNRWAKPAIWLPACVALAIFVVPVLLLRPNREGLGRFTVFGHSTFHGMIFLRVLAVFRRLRLKLTVQLQKWRLFPTADCPKRRVQKKRSFVVPCWPTQDCN